MSVVIRADLFFGAFSQWRSQEFATGGV